MEIQYDDLVPKFLLLTEADNAGLRAKHARSAQMSQQTIALLTYVLAAVYFS